MVGQGVREQGCTARRDNAMIHKLDFGRRTPRRRCAQTPLPRSTAVRTIGVGAQDGQLCCVRLVEFAAVAHKLGAGHHHRAQPIFGTLQQRGSACGGPEGSEGAHIAAVAGAAVAVVARHGSKVAHAQVLAKHPELHSPALLLALSALNSSGGGSTLALAAPGLQTPSDGQG